MRAVDEEARVGRDRAGRWLRPGDEALRLRMDLKVQGRKKVRKSERRQPGRGSRLISLYMFSIAF